MFKSFSSSSHLRILTLLLLLLSSDVHLNPGPVQFLTLPVEKGQTTITVPNPFSGPKFVSMALTFQGTSDIKFSFFGLAAGTILVKAAGATTQSIAGPYQFYTSSDELLRVVIENPADGTIGYLTLIYSSETALSAPLDVKVVNPPTDPLPISGQVSLANPLPSVASTFLSAFKK
jgi:hypothetical protein